MSLLFIDGGEGQEGALLYDTFDFAASSTTTRFSSGRSIQPNNTVSKITKRITASAEVFCGFAYYTGSTGAMWLGTGFFQMLGDSAATSHIGISLTAANAIEIRRGSTVVATSANGLVPLNTWVYLEVRATINDTTGVVDVRLNGNTTAVVSFSGDTKNGGTNSTIDAVQWTAGVNSVTNYLDDIYVCNALGSTNNTWLGDCRVQTLVPTGAGTTTGLTPSTGSNWQNVDEAPPSSTDYNGSDVAGTRDTYAITDLVSGTATVKGVRQTVAWHKSDAGAKSMKTAMFIPGGSTIAADNFNRANGSLGSTSTGSLAWTNLNGTFAISSNTIALSSGGTLNYCVVDPGVADCTIELKCSTMSVDAWGLYVRGVDTNNGLICILPGTTADTPAIYKRVSGTNTSLATGSSTTCASGDVIKVVLAGNQITVYKNGTQVVTVSDATHNTATKHGVYKQFVSTAAFDDFSIKTNDVLAYGSSTALATSMALATEYREVSPATSAAWTVSEVNAMEIGAEVV